MRDPRDLGWFAAAAVYGGLRIEPVLAGQSTVGHTWGFHGRALPEHLFYLVTAGGYRYDVAGLAGTAGPGALLWLPPGLRHDLTLPTGASSMTLYHFRFRVFEGDRELRLDRAVIAPGFGHLREWCEWWLAACRGEDAICAMRLPALLALLAAELLEQARRHERDRGGLGPEQRRRLEAYVGKRLQHQIRPADLALHLDLSPAYFARQFKRSYGCAPRTWLKLERLRRGRLLLQTTGMSVSDVAAALGYAGPQLFCRQFRVAFGVTPGRARR